MDWRDTLKGLNIDSTKVSESLENVVNSSRLEAEIQETGRKLASQKTLVRGEVSKLNIPESGPVTLHVRFDPDEVSGASVTSFKLNDVEVIVDGQSSWPSSRAADGRPQVEWVIQGSSDPEKLKYLRHQSSYSVEGSLDGRRTFTAYHDAKV